MTATSNMSATLLLVTGLLSVSMAAMGYYYLQINSKKTRTPSADESETGEYKGQKGPAACPSSRGLTDEEKLSGAKCPVTSMLASSTGSSQDDKEESVASPTEETVTTSVEALKPAPACPKILHTNPKQVVDNVVESPVKMAVQPHAVVETTKHAGASPKKEVTSSPKKEVAASPKKEIPKSSPKETPKSSLKTTAESPKVAEEPTVLELPQPVHASPDKALESPMKTDASPKKATESPTEEAELAAIELPKQDPASPIKTPESAKKPVEAPESPKKVVESPKRVIVSPKKAAELASAVEEQDAVTRKSSEDFVVTQAAIETAHAFTDELLQKSLENITLEHEEYVQVELTQSMTLSQSTPEFINIEDALAKTEGGKIQTSAATEDEESIVEEEEEQEQVSVEPAPVVEAAVESEALATLASPKSPHTSSTSWEDISSSPVVRAPSAEETATSLSVDTTTESPQSTASVESAEAAEALLISVPAENTENTEAPVKDKHAVSPVSSGGSSSGKRSRNRSKKAKNKRKKAKKHQTFKA